jgi:hypothetical protein
MQASTITQQDPIRGSPHLLPTWGLRITFSLAVVHGTFNWAANSFADSIIVHRTLCIIA